MPVPAGNLKKLLVQMPCDPPAPRGRRHNDPVDIHKPIVFMLKPDEVRAAVIRRLIERDQKTIGAGTRRVVCR